MISNNQAKLHLADLESTKKFGQYIGKNIAPHTLLVLGGEIGSGKTTLAKSIAHGLGVKETVNSPTFVIMNEYHSGRLSLYHLDLYRLYESGSEIISFDLIAAQLDEILNTKCVIIIEWANIFFDLYGKDLSNLGLNETLSINLEADKMNEYARLVTLTPLNGKEKTSSTLFKKIGNCQKQL